eukprot:TRINITY_DN418_c0_g1_i1.p1 TRINITY_DN418_c0_g1~~TRINITY_DN418_c0_g1_i1.p1  ORF type:complete len:245 (-),score=85.86 TRINITY_DN418_c0_g1_i1:75-743(-)
MDTTQNTTATAPAPSVTMVHDPIEPQPNQPIIGSATVVSIPENQTKTQTGEALKLTREAVGAWTDDAKRAIEGGKETAVETLDHTKQVIVDTAKKASETIQTVAREASVVLTAKAKEASETIQQTFVTAKESVVATAKDTSVAAQQAWENTKETVSEKTAQARNLVAETIMPEEKKQEILTKKAEEELKGLVDTIQATTPTQPSTQLPTQPPTQLPTQPPTQ